MAGEGGSAAAAAGLLNGGTGEGPGGKRARLGSAPHSSPAGNRVTVVLGAQWGDEGKGKVVDLLSLDADLVCRCQVSRLLCFLGAGGTTKPISRGWGNYKSHPPRIGGLGSYSAADFSSHPHELGGLQIPPSADLGGLKSHPL